MRLKSCRWPGPSRHVGVFGLERMLAEAAQSHKNV